MPLAAGTRLGSYEILDAIGRGSMGEVYRAHDSKLNRAVAIKIVRTELSSDPGRVARFKREAQILARVNHPAVGQVYSLEDSTGVVAVVLELIEGATLAERLAAGPVP